MSFANKITLLTGARGIAKEIAEQLAQGRSKLIIVSASGSAEELEQDVNTKCGIQAEGLRSDLSSEEPLKL